MISVIWTLHQDSCEFFSTFEQKAMEQQFLEETRRELINGYAKKRHPFRYFTLATLNNGKPRQRTVVLRKMLPDFNLLLYTDKRSQKVADITANSAVSALFYHPKKLIQLRLEGKAQVITDKDQLKDYWTRIAETSKKDYITTLAPGTAIENPDHTTYNEDNPYFCALQIIPETIEYLRLKRPHHLRIKYVREAARWEGQFLVP
jgi:pyridoxine/pyridoxamine 5'-phosphate oxidase